jgi:MoxR-like ATPase
MQDIPVGSGVPPAASNQSSQLDAVLASRSDETPATSVPEELGSAAEPTSALLEDVLFEIKRLIVGQDYVLERLLVALLARGHVLLEGVPGLAKTAMVKALAEVVGGSFGRVQFTPDLVPADLVGTRIYNGHTAEFAVELGPVFVNLLLADEINRAPAKVQSALLEVMQERQVTIGKQTFKVPDPYLVLATQNPIESDGTYPLPEAQMDRFMFKVLVDYPSYLDEIVVVARISGPPITLQRLMTLSQLLTLQRAAEQVYVDPSVTAYAARLVAATRRPVDEGLPQLADTIQFGASPRASINLILGARALALMRGRGHAVARDVADLAPDVLRHRVLLTYEAIADGTTSDDVVAQVLAHYPPPQMELGDPHVAEQA